MKKIIRFIPVLFIAAVLLPFSCSKPKETAVAAGTKTSEPKAAVVADMKQTAPAQETSGKSDVPAVNDSSAGTSASGSSKAAAAPALKEEVVTAETFDQDWIIGKWSIILDGGTGSPMEGECEITGTEPSSTVIGDGFTETLEEFRRELFEGMLVSFNQSSINQLKQMNATVKGDGKLRVNAARNEMKATLTASFGQMSQTITFTMKKK